MNKNEWRFRKKKAGKETVNDLCTVVLGGEDSEREKERKNERNWKHEGTKGNERQNQMNCKREWGKERKELKERRKNERNWKREGKKREEWSENKKERDFFYFCFVIKMCMLTGKLDFVLRIYVIPKRRWRRTNKYSKMTIKSTNMLVTFCQQGSERNGHDLRDFRTPHSAPL